MVNELARGADLLAIKKDVAKQIEEVSKRLSSKIN